MSEYQVSDKIREWVEALPYGEGAVVRTLDGKQPVRAYRTADGWVFEADGWSDEPEHRS